VRSVGQAAGAEAGARPPHGDVVEEAPVRLERGTLYRLPWSLTDNPGGWVEVTDACELSCPGCYRHKLAGHVPLATIKEDVLAVRRLTNCDRVAIAGGEPLLYPHILEVVEFIARQGLKPLLLTNGERLTLDLARDFRKAGLAKFHFHVDCGMQRPGWVGKNEAEMNALRQHFADLVWEAGGMQCGFNVTVFRSSLPYLPEVLEWCRRNLHKVAHVSLVAFRSIPLTDAYEYWVDGRPVDARPFQHATADLEKITVTSDEMYASLRAYDPGYTAAVYLPGTSAPETHKFLVTLQVGSAAGLYGYLGPTTVELVQVAHHLWTGRYVDFTRDAEVGKKVFLMAAVDGKVRRALKRFAGAAARHPRRLLDRIYVQSVSLQQPNEMVRGQANLCGGCPNMMVYEGALIPSCRLDEYRRFGGPMTPVPRRADRAGAEAERAGTAPAAVARPTPG
jgi:hypothetical protein